MEKIIRAFWRLLTRFPNQNVRVWALRKLGYCIGKDVYVGPNLTITMGLLDKTAKLTLENRVSFGPHVTLIMSTHPNHSRLNPIIKHPTRLITIGHDSWVGANAIIMPNIKIGKYCIIGAGSVVTHDIPDYTIVAGVPARKIGEVDKTKLLQYGE